MNRPIPLDFAELARPPVWRRHVAERLGVTEQRLKDKRWRAKYGLVESAQPPSCYDERYRFYTAGSVEEAERRLAAHRAALLSRP